MFNFKNNPKDLKKDLEKVKKTMNKGLVGFLIKIFFGKDFMNKVNPSLDQGSGILDTMENSKAVMHNGKTATAEVLSVKDTNATMNVTNFVLILRLLVTSDFGDKFEITSQVLVPRIAVPRVGDKIKIKYNPNDRSQIIIV